MKTSRTGPGQVWSKRKSLGPFLLGLFVLGIAAAIAISLYLGYTDMVGGSAPQTPRQFAVATAGARVQIVIEVIGMPSRTLLTGNLLQKNGDGSYSRTGTMVSVTWGGTRIVMGSTSDIKVGAILQANGLLGIDNVLRAEQMVILTGFVQMK